MTIPRRLMTCRPRADVVSHGVAEDHFAADLAQMYGVRVNQEHPNLSRVRPQRVGRQRPRCCPRKRIARSRGCRLVFVESRGLHRLEQRSHGRSAHGQLLYSHRGDRAAARGVASCLAPMRNFTRHPSGRSEQLRPWSHQEAVYCAGMAARRCRDHSRALTTVGIFRVGALSPDRGTRTTTPTRGRKKDHHADRT